MLRVVQQEEPSEAINEQRLAEVADDPAVQESLDRQIPAAAIFGDHDEEADAFKVEGVEDSGASS